VIDGECAGNDGKVDYCNEQDDETWVMGNEHLSTDEDTSRVDWCGALCTRGASILPWPIPMTL